MSDDTTPPSAKREATRKNAQDHFAASQRRDLEVRKELDRQQAAATAQIAKLRALRLAKEEADRVEAAAKPPAAPAPRKARRIKV
jgi:uncharacterized membrane protein YgaE (UPF0421/DUF939 family)